MLCAARAPQVQGKREAFISCRSRGSVMNSLKVVLVGLLLCAAARAQPQRPAFKPYAERESSDTMIKRGGYHSLGGPFSQLMEGGLYHFAERRYAEALEKFKRAVNTPPSGPENYNLWDAYYSLGVAYEVVGRRAEAMAAYRQVGEVQLKGGQDEYHDALTKVTALYNLANLHADAGQHKDAITMFKQVATLAPNVATPHYNMGLSYAALGETEAAIAAFEQALKQKPAEAASENNEQVAKAHYNLGVAQGAAKRYSAAAEAFKEAVRLAPNYAEAHYNLGLTYKLLGDHKSAQRQQDILAKLKPQFAEELKSAIK
jgi:tetratricopeptide (TPR) repeat protein